MLRRSPTKSDRVSDILTCFVLTDPRYLLLGLNSFLSTPKFIKCLTELSERLGMMRDASKAKKTKIL